MNNGYQLRFRPFATLFTIAVFSIVVCGCVPERRIYWAPIAEGGKLAIADRGGLGPKDKIQFTLDTVRVFLSGDGNAVRGGLIIPKDRVASFVSDQAELLDAISQITTKITIEAEVLDSTYTQWVVRDPIEGVSGRQLSFSVLFGTGEKSHYSVKLPAIRVNGTVHDLPVVEFTKKEGFGVYPINN